MSRTQVVLAGSERLKNSEARFWHPILNAWPDTNPPQASVVTLRSLIHMLEHPQMSVSAGIVVLTRDDGVEAADRALDALSQRNMPCLVLTEDHERWSAWQHPAMIQQHWGQDPGVLAGMLFALLERQKFIDSLSRELALAMRCHAGVRSEIERMHEELHLAAGIQHEFTAAAMPRVPGLEFGVIYRPVNMVSGDIYNVREIEPGVVSFFVADAVGHGVPAALLTMVLTNSLISTEENHRGGQSRRCSPAQVLAKLNQRLVEGSASSGRFATAVYGHFHAATGEVVMSSAGHPFPLIVGAKEHREVDCPGPLLGVFPDATFEEVRFVITPGETLAVFSDGLEAAFGVAAGRRTDNPHIHQQSLAQSLTACPSGTGDPLALLDATIDEQTGSLHQVDDVTVLAMRRLAIAGKAAA